MFKKLDSYIIKTFFGPFFMVFSIVFFIFMVNIIWIQLGQLMGKGLTYFEIIKLLGYLSVSVVSMVLPLTILLSSIMTFGEFGERYELAAMKAAGISLTRIMLPLFFISFLLSIMLFFFSNNLVPDFQRKAKNMLYNITLTRPALNFTPGQFIDQIPGYLVKFDKIEGENAELLEGVFIRKLASSYENQQSIVAKKGAFGKAEDRKFIKMLLYDGYVFEENIATDMNRRQNQEDQAIKFDTLTFYFDISKVIERAIEQEQITDDYRFKNFNELNTAIAVNVKDNDKIFTNLTSDLVNQTSNFIPLMTSANKSSVKPAEQKGFETAPTAQKTAAVQSAYSKIEMLKAAVSGRNVEIEPSVKYYSRMVIYQQRIISYSVTCLIFFLIGSSLGSIIRKGGMGLPVVIAIVIFIIFYVLNLTIENLSWAGKINPYIGSWIPNAVLFPFSIWLTYSALTDSQLFDLEKYKALLKPLTKRFTKNKEHSRYQ